MLKLNKDKYAAIKSIYSKNPNYVREGYYDYPELNSCWGFDRIKIKYTRNHMHLLILPHGLKVKRRIHKWDKTVYPNGENLFDSLELKNGKDLAYVLHQLDSAHVLPCKSMFKYVRDKIMGVFKKIF